MGGGTQGVLKQGTCSIALGVSELMVGEAPAPRGLKSPAIHHDLSAPALLGSACNAPPLPVVSFSMGVLATSTVFSGQKDGSGHTVQKPGQFV